MSTDPPLPNDKREVRRTIPQLRDAIRDYMRERMGETIETELECAGLPIVCFARMPG
jgi:hypothetical protein